MGLKEIQINFDNPWATYYAGDTVTGELLLTLDAPKQVREITLKLKGEASVRWTERETERDNENKEITRDVDYTASEKYFENNFVLLGGSETPIEIPTGAHTYKFSSILPATLPSSFEGEFGYVRYTVKATLNRPWKFDQDCKAAFTVISPLDLNQHEDAKKSIHVEKEKYVGILCCRSGPLTATLNVPFSGFVSGQTIPANVEVENLTNSDMTGTFNLNRVVTYKSMMPSQLRKVDKINITKINLDSLGAHSSDKRTLNLIVPVLPQSNLSNCKIIDVDYELKLELKVPGIIFNRKLNIKAPVIFGTIPIVNSYQVSSNSPAVPAESKGSPTGDIGWNMPGDGNVPKNSLYPDLPLPAYEISSIGKSADIRDKDDSEYTQITTGWAPRYPTYNFVPSAPVQA